MARKWGWKKKKARSVVHRVDGEVLNRVGFGQVWEMGSLKDEVNVGIVVLADAGRGERRM